MMTTEPKGAPAPSHERILRVGRMLYEQLRLELERTYRGRWVAINVEDGRYAIGRSSIEAQQEFNMKFGPASGFVWEIGKDLPYS